METLQLPRPLSRTLECAKIIILVSSVLIFPFCLVFCAVAAAATISFAIATALAAGVYDEYIYAKSFQGCAESLHTALNAAKRQITAIENENKTLKALQGILAGTRAALSSEQQLVTGSIQDELSATENKIDSSPLDVDREILPAEIELLDDLLRSGEISNVALYCSLRYANEKVAKLTTHLERMSLTQAASDRRIHQLEQERQEFQKGKSNLRRVLAQAHMLTNSNMSEVEQLESHFDGTGTSTIGEPPRETEPSHTATIPDFQFPSEQFHDAVEMQELVPALTQNGGSRISMGGTTLINIEPPPITAPSDSQSPSDQLHIAAEHQEQIPPQSTLAQEHIVTHDFAPQPQPQPMPRHASPITSATSSASQEDDMHAANLETIIKRRVYSKLDLAFEVCRKQGRFSHQHSTEEGSSSSARYEPSMNIRKVKKDSLRSIEEALREILSHEKERGKRLIRRVHV
ncbi:hypothetical protein K458DRAFT_427069 [Lentithecium fluviatile CBS 122367]|uniref:Uncharacterized protein n=1 Tax=Lentithecium fluviatile CBS 122367 TaxID=1168545 RepID=A0A6G1JJE0_9PLEO|nr:hypothetical protein K458DRAFT_427069 [Lentithecium fluviatile CBS 122367]